MPPRRFKPLLLLCLAIAFPMPGQAHESGTSYLTLDVFEDSLHVVFKFDITDLERVFGLDANGDGTIERHELQAQMPEMVTFLQSHTALRLDYLPATLHPQAGRFQSDELGNLFVVFPFAAAATAQPSVLSLRLEYFASFGANFKTLGLASYRDITRQMIFTEATPLVQLDLNEAGPGLIRQLGAFVYLGIEHIFIGIDHIMFLFGLLVLGGSFWNLVKIVTSFTISHSITLILAALGLVTFPGWLVESVIALSIIYIAVENFYLQKTDTRWLVTGLFGFVHGFGFANVLGDLGLPGRHLVSSLFAFNVGVELGQIAIVAVMLPVIWLVQRSAFRRQFVFASSAVLLFFGATWFLDRAFGLPVALL